MRGLIVLTFLLLLPFVAAEDSSLGCQYQDSYNVTHIETLLVTNDGTQLSNFLNVRNIMYLNTTRCDIRFEVYNNAPVEVRVTIKYGVEINNGTSTYVEQEVFYGAKIPSHESQRLSVYDERLMCRLREDSFSYVYEENNYTHLEEKTVVEVKYKCRMCGDAPCVNDGAPCPYSSRCGSDLCWQGTCLAECPSGFLRDNETCRQVGTKKAGETYVKEVECASGFGLNSVCIECASDAQCTRGLCNLEMHRCVEYYHDTFKCDIKGENYIPCNATNTCVLPSSKKNGEGYSCMEECESTHGKAGVCSATLFQRFIKGLVILLSIAFISIVIWWAFLKREVNSTKRRISEAQASLAELVTNFESKLEAEKRSIQERIQREINSTIQESERKKREIENEIYRKFQQLRGLEREDLEKRSQLQNSISQNQSKLQNLEAEYKHKLHLLNEKMANQENDAERRAQKAKQKLEEVQETLAEENKTSQKLTTPRPSQILGSGVYIWCDPDDYFYPYYVGKNSKGEYTVKQSKNNGDWPIHKQEAYNHIFMPNINFFRKKYGKIVNFNLEPKKVFEKLVVHHIDRSKMNYKLRNLAIISWEEHHSTEHTKRIHNWKTGIEELRRLKIKQPHLMDVLKD